MLRLALATLGGLATLGVMGGCGGSGSRTMSVVPSLPDCLGGRVVSAVTLTALGDFPPGPGQTISVQPVGRTSLRLPDGTRAVQIEASDEAGLVAFGRSGTLDLDHSVGLASDGSLPLAFGPPDTFCALPAMHLPRTGHRATRLSSGRVLLSGGADANGQAVTQLELYLPVGDATSGPATFEVVDSGSSLESVAALGQAVAALSDGGAIVTGGAPSNGGVADGPAYSGFTRHDGNGAVTGPALILRGGQGRAFHTATTLADGRVLLAGGCGALMAGTCTAGQMLASTVIYQPKTGQQVDGPPLRRPRFGHDAILRGDGAVILVGGVTVDGSEPPMELVDPDAARGFDVGNGTGRAALLDTGAIVTVGASPVPSIRTVLWLGTSDVDSIQSLPAPVQNATVTALEDGSILVAGGTSLPATTLPAATVIDRWGQVQKTLDFRRTGLTATRLLDGSVLLAGGAGADQQVDGAASVYLRSELGPWSSLPALSLNSADDPLMPRRPSAARYTGNHLELTATAAGDGGRPSEAAIIGGPMYEELSLSIQLGTRANGSAALLFGWISDGSYTFAKLTPGQPAQLFQVTPAAGRAGQSTVTEVQNCQSQTIDPSELPESGATWQATWSTTLTLSTSRPILSCPIPATRGHLGLAAMTGTISAAALNPTR